jgi:hypothetical protein
MCDIGDVDLALHAGPNAISFYALPADGDYSVSNIFDSSDEITKVFAEGTIAFDLGASGWVGALTDVDATSGYWAILDNADNLEVSGLPTGNVEYAVHTGNTFLSYSYYDGQSLDHLPSVASDNTVYIYGESTFATQNPDGDWVGSLAGLGFEGGKGYWFGASDNFVFSYNSPSSQLGRFIAKTMPEIPVELAYNQSTAQYFYLVTEANIDNVGLSHGDWIVAYNNDVIVGARQYESGSVSDVPIMGVDGEAYSAGYCEPGDIPTIKIHRTTGEVVDMNVTAVEGSLAFMGSDDMHAKVTLSNNMLPMEVSLHSAYPNPFNPSTMIEYELPEGSMQVNLSIYDLRGRLVQEFVNEVQNGSVESYKVVWNAEMNSSGVYFVQLTAGNTVKNQKIMLVK